MSSSDEKSKKSESRLETKSAMPEGTGGEKEWVGSCEFDKEVADVVCGL
jgi:hypothetical protein